MFVGNVEYMCSFVLLDNPLMESGITDNTKVPTERVQEVHEIMDNGFTDKVESGFYNECDFICGGVSYELLVVVCCVFP
jgi:hypothetical protein